jgi:CubicO group peptidase (beta-lactamase class C family)
MRNWRVVVSAVIVLEQAFSPVASAATQPPVFENNLRRAITIEGHEQERFKLADRMAHYGVPGLGVAIVDHCRIADARGFGRAAEDGSPVTTQTLFQAASMSKPLAAVAALRLVEQGKLQLDTDVRPLLHDWTPPRDPKAGNDPITLRELLGHTAGTNVEGFGGYVPGARLPKVIQILRGQAPANNDPVRVETRPGSTFNYSGGGYVIVQALMTAVSNQSFPSLMQRLVLGPAAMRSSTYAQPLDSEHAAHAAQGAGPDGTPMPMKWHVYPELAPAGLWATPTDYARFMIALARTVRGDDHRLLTATSVRQLMTRGPGNWGLGVDLGPDNVPRQFGHTGANAGYQSAFIMYPDTCQGAVVMTNSDEGNWLMSEVMDAIGAAYGWPGHEAPKVQTAVRVTRGIIEQFAGTYRLHDYPTEKFTISQKPDGTLYWARVGHIGRDLLPQSATRLFSPDNAMTLQVRSSSGGKATSLNLSFGGGVLNVADRAD